MFTSTFIFSAKPLDAAFHALDQAIAVRARALPGYLGEEAWVNPDTGVYANVYYWTTREALQALVQDPLHGQAKARQGEWLQSYRVVIAEVTETYGDPTLGWVTTAGAA